MAKILFTVLFVVLIQGVMSPGASAQRSCKIWIDYCPACGETVPPEAHDCFVEITILVTCALPDYECPPSDICLQCLSSNTTPAGGKPVDIATGDTYIVETDTSIPGLDGGLSLTRQWNSLWQPSGSAYEIGIFGPNWRSTYEEQVFVGSDHYFKYLRSDGSIWSFGFGPSKPGRFQSAFMMLATPVPGFGSRGTKFSLGSTGGGGGDAAVYVAPSYFSLQFSGGEERRFDINNGKLVAIVDRNGNNATITYNSMGHIDTVTDPASRHLYFHYGTPTNSLVTSITTDFGVTMSYSYDTSGRLIQVTEPDSSTISYVYDSHSMITSVLDSNGHVLETHTYDSSGRGLTASQADGVNAVTLSYSN